MSTKGRSDYYAPGDWNACCDRCCAKFKASKLRKDWQGFMLCEWCWEPRHPQDFVRGRADPAPLPWVRECSHDTFVTFCTTPLAAFTITVDEADPLTISYASTTPSTDACPVTCEYDFGDGGTSTDCSGTHTYASGGTYAVAYTATSPGGTATVTEDVTVEEPPPTYATELFVDFDEFDMDYAAAHGVTFDSPIAPFNDFSGTIFEIYASPNGGYIAGYRYVDTPSTTYTINIDTDLLRIRNLTAQSCFTNSPSVEVYVNGTHFTLSRYSTSHDEVDFWLTSDIVTDALLTANGHPTGYVTKIVCEVVSGYLYMDALDFY